jgi:hypothetical protein
LNDVSFFTTEVADVTEVGDCIRRLLDSQEDAGLIGLSFFHHRGHEGHGGWGLCPWEVGISWAGGLAEFLFYR